MSIDPQTIARAQSWSQLDPNVTSSAYVDNLIKRVEDDKDESASKELQSLFPEGKRIGFGTAGLRSAMKPGPLGMNDLVVMQTAQGLAKYCLCENDTSKGRLCAVVGYDHRANETLQLSSLSFATLTALVFREAGMDCVLLDGLVATPLVPFCLGQIQQAVVGVMITASHNPKQDAGYKVYWNDGCQIREPIDKKIADSILENMDPWTDYRTALLQRKKEHPDDPCLGLSSPEMTTDFIDRYFAAIKASGLCTGQSKLLDESGWQPPTFVYTAMHGVGYRFTKASFENFGLPEFLSVTEQENPDPNFPTVVFPNPEEKGALDRAKAYAADQVPDKSKPVVLVANDPDADRLAVAERTNGQWHVFTGDQIGVMLGHWLWMQAKDSSDDTRPISMCASTVSSHMLRQIAKVEGFHFEDTLTGFKWIGSRAASLNSSSYRNIFCYEEAIGFCCGNVIFDKDGVTAAAVLAELALFTYHSGKKLADHMQGLYDKYGEFVSNNGYYILQDLSIVPSLMDHMTNSGKFDRKAVGEYQIESVRYLGEPSYDSTQPDRKPTLPTSASSPMMTLRFTNGCVAQFRASGTEPKFKYYIEMKGKPGVARVAVQAELEKISEVLMAELLQPTRFGLSKL
uniref:Uncharacterized protein n=1 Tax=Amphora coffeiformis TaxID=265554 RepID=A0A7S3KVY3_9STRA|mmetsp:Transcript_15006/g.28433  ORF Transcript_15006/g.28433 Transcript_15006/m.28433 type:complete len:627 (+) Transcript_15006:89-1969(+)